MASIATLEPQIWGLTTSSTESRVVVASESGEQTRQMDNNLESPNVNKLPVSPTLKLDITVPGVR